MSEESTQMKDEPRAREVQDLAHELTFMHARWIGARVAQPDIEALIKGCKGL